MLFVNIAITIATLIFMEAAAWFTHKYIMHGILWSWHRSHHTHHNHALERNDLFALVFSFLAVAIIIIGLQISSLWLLAPIGLGITLYGLFYFIFHDIIVHRRIKIKFKAKHPYMKRIMHAHYVHHKVHSKNGAEAFGFLYAPKKYNQEDVLKKEA